MKTSLKNKEYAELKALEALSWLSKNPDRFADFLNLNGASISDIFERSKDPEFFVFIIEYCLSSDEIAIECSNALSIKPEELMEILNLLPGGDSYNWT